MDKKMLVIIRPDEYLTFLDQLGEKGYTWSSGYVVGDGSCVYERLHNTECSTVYCINITKKEISYFPAEIYAEDSPTHDKKKFDEIMNDCKTVTYARLILF